MVAMKRPRIPNDRSPIRRVVPLLPFDASIEQHLREPNLIVEHHLDPSLPRAQKSLKTSGCSARDKPATGDDAPFLHGVQRHIGARHERDVHVGKGQLLPNMTKVSYPEAV